MQKLSDKTRLLLFCFLLGTGTLFVSLNQNLKYPVTHFAGEIWADKAGYYSYLPATFIYGWDARKMPAKIDSLTGGGFALEGNKILTKYPPGEAVLEMPFFLIAHSLQLILDKNQATGFTPVYHTFRIFSSIFWVFFGLYILGLMALKKGFRFKQVCGLLGILFFGTNLAYFEIWQPAMSHGYAFFACCWLLYLLAGESKKYTPFLIGLAFGLICSIRSVNGILLLPIFYLFFEKTKEIITSWKKIIQFMTALFLGIFPELLHWMYLKNAGTAPYSGEKFSHASNPWIAEIYFSATNGIAIYTPLLFILLLLILIQILNPESRKKAMIIIGVFFMVTLLYASWWVPTMGCGLGHRSFIDFLPLVFLGIIETKIASYLFQKIWISFAIFCMLYTSVMAWKYPGCLEDGNGQKVWNWAEYRKVLYNEP